jgi:hypothetical protein
MTPTLRLVIIILVYECLINSYTAGTHVYRAIAQLDEAECSWGQELVKASVVSCMF